MTWSDVAILGILGLSILMAAVQGFFVEIFSLAGVVVGYLAAAWGCRQAGEWFLPYVKTAEFANLAGFLTILFAVMLVAGMAGRIARWAMKEAGLRWVDRFLGAAFGLLRGIVAVTAILLAMTAFDPGTRLLRDSRLAGYFLVAGRGASWVAPAELRRKFREGLETLRTTGPQPGAARNGK